MFIYVCAKIFHYFKFRIFKFRLFCFHFWNRALQNSNNYIYIFLYFTFNRFFYKFEFYSIFCQN